jgi:hypothetical protein
MRVFRETGPERKKNMKDQSATRSLRRRPRLGLARLMSAMSDTPAGVKEGLHEARALKDFRVRTSLRRRLQGKAA